MKIAWPARAQVIAVGRHVVTAGAAAIGLMGALGLIAPADAAGATNAWNTLAASLGTLVTIISGSYAGASANPIAQADAVARQGMTVVASPEIANSLPDNARVLSSSDVKVVSK